MSVANTRLETKLEFFRPNFRILLALAKGAKNYKELFSIANVSWFTFTKNIKELAEAGLIKKVDDGIYEITEKGIAVLREIKQELDEVVG